MGNRTSEKTAAPQDTGVRRQEAASLKRTVEIAAGAPAAGKKKASVSTRRASVKTRKAAVKPEETAESAARPAQTDGSGAAAQGPEGAVSEKAFVPQEMPLSGQPEGKAQRTVKPNAEFCPVLAKLPVYLL